MSDYTFSDFIEWEKKDAIKTLRIASSIIQYAHDLVNAGDQPGDSRRYAVHMARHILGKAFSSDAAVARLACYLLVAHSRNYNEGFDRLLSPESLSPEIETLFRGRLLALFRKQGLAFTARFGLQMLEDTSTRQRLADFTVTMSRNLSFLIGGEPVTLGNGSLSVSDPEEVLLGCSNAKEILSTTLVPGDGTAVVFKAVARFSLPDDLAQDYLACAFSGSFFHEYRKVPIDGSIFTVPIFSRALA